MKKYILPLIAGFVMGIIGFIVGHQIGASNHTENQFNNTDTIENNSGPLNIKVGNQKRVKDLSYEELKNALLKKEKDNILQYLEISGEIETKKRRSDV